MNSAWKIASSAWFKPRPLGHEPSTLQLDYEFPLKQAAILYNTKQIKKFKVPEIFWRSKPGKWCKNKCHDDHPNTDAKFSGQIIGEIWDQDDENASTAIQSGYYTCYEK